MLLDCEVYTEAIKSLAIKSQAIKLLPLTHHAFMKI